MGFGRGAREALSSVQNGIALLVLRISSSKLGLLLGKGRHGQLVVSKGQVQGSILSENILLNSKYKLHYEALMKKILVTTDLLA